MTTNNQTTHAPPGPIRTGRAGCVSSVPSGPAAGLARARKDRQSVLAGWVITVVVSLCPALVPSAFAQFNAGGSFGTSRTQFTLTALCDGSILAVGGQAAEGAALASVERYDPGQRNWTYAAPMQLARSSHTATLLPDCRVLVAGGSPLDARATAEVFEPHTDSWTTVGELTVGRYLHSASLLSSGNVLVVGGVSPESGNARGTTAAELFDPQSGTFSTTNPLSVGRYAHAAVTLTDGRVVVAGGTAAGGNAGAAATSTEIYDPTTRIWSPAGSMATGRWQDFSMTRLPNDQVLVAGGVTDWTVAATATAELFDGATNLWAPTASMPTTRFGHSATLLRNGGVVVVGGNDHPNAFGSGVTLSTVTIYDSTTRNWRITESAMSHPRQTHLAQLLSSGDVLIAGGTNAGGGVAAAEVYRYSADSLPEFGPPQPGIEDPPDQTTVTGPTTLQIVVIDEDGDSLNCSATGLPPGLVIDPASCVIAGILTPNSAGVYPTTVSVTDGTTSTSVTFTWTVTAVNLAPTLAAVALQTAAENDTIALPLTAADLDGDVLFCSASGLPPGLIIDATACRIGGTLAFTAAGSYEVSVTVTDGVASVTTRFTWQVANTNRAPLVTSPGNRTNREGDIIINDSAAAPTPIPPALGPAPVSGTGAPPLGGAPAPSAPCVVSVRPLLHDFGSVVVDSAEERTYTVQNVSTCAALSGTASTTAPFSVVSGGSFSLAPFESHSVAVRFRPADTTFVSRSVEFTSNGGWFSAGAWGTGIRHPDPPPPPPPPPHTTTAASTATATAAAGWPEPTS